MERKTGSGLGHDLNAWQRKMWNGPEARHPRYAAFKSALYSLIDPRFSAYFDTAGKGLIRLDEIVWGGVRQDGIPPLRDPAMLAAEDAGYLEDDHIVFGLSVNGDARAYPKRILGWHEMFVDTVGGMPVAGVYCTLCGTVILYYTEHEGVNHRLGTSGFLYRSNKLMYDQATQSLWSTMRGAPVVGPLAGKGIALKSGAVVTTTWGEWRRRHPATRVLSLDTGHRRDYAEGAAYRDYYATDELMFQVPVLDTRLKNKDEVFTLLLPGHPEAPLAISAAFLAATPVHHDAIEDTPLVVLTDLSGANRAYASEDVTFTRYDGDRQVEDGSGMIWTMDRAHPDRHRRACSPPYPGAAGVLVRLVRRVPEHPAGAVTGGRTPWLRKGVPQPGRGLDAAYPLDLRGIGRRRACQRIDGPRLAGDSIQPWLSSLSIPVPGATPGILRAVRRPRRFPEEPESAELEMFEDTPGGGPEAVVAPGLHRRGLSRVKALTAVRPCPAR